MTGPREYLAILSKAMRENRTESGFDKKSYDDLYTIVHSELNAQLKASLYPEAPALMQRINRMLDDMEPLFICSQIIGKACLLLSNYRTNEVFSKLSSVFLNAQFAEWMARISTQLPFVVVHGDTDSIELLNYANQRVPLSPAEYRLLITESGKNRVALNKIVQVFIIQTPLKKENACFIFDNVYQTAKHIFERAICKCVMCVNRTGLGNIRKHGLPYIDAVTCGIELEGELSEIGNLYNCPLIKQDGLEDYFNNCVFPILYGFRDEFRSFRIQIESFYLNGAQQARATAQEITSDIVRLGSGADQTLTSIQKASRAKATIFENERKKIHDILVRTEECIVQVEATLHDTLSPEKMTPRRVYNDLFNSLFDAEQNCTVFGQEILSRLISLGYGECELVTAYIQSVAGQNPQIAYGPVKRGEWEKAKMYLEIADLTYLPTERLREYVNAIGASRLVTGKEYYAKSLIVDDQSKTPTLKDSFDRRYEPAGPALLARYKKGDRQVNLQTLSNALVPEACMMMADQQKAKNRGRYQFTNLSDLQFTYYKIAAAREYLPAIGEIVVAIYQSRFAQAYQLHDDQFHDPKFQEMIENGQAICQLCRFLIDKMYQVKRFSEILGVVLFCLNANLSEAMALLSGIDTGVANYCKGNLYEFGSGVAVDIDQAALHYQRALDQGFRSKQLERRLAACQGKRYQNEARKKAANNYQAEKSYHPTTSNQSSSSSTCVITTAACQTLSAADDCEELQLLRWFRDAHLQDTAEDEAIVREYYRVGPLITDSIGKTPDPHGVYRYLWNQYIAPSCAAVRAEQWSAAKSIYIQMVKELCEKFGIGIRPQIYEVLEYYQDGKG